MITGYIVFDDNDDGDTEDDDVDDGDTEDDDVGDGDTEDDDVNDGDTEDDDVDDGDTEDDDVDDGDTEDDDVGEYTEQKYLLTILTDNDSICKQWLEFIDSWTSLKQWRYRWNL